MSHHSSPTPGFPNNSFLDHPEKKNKQQAELCSEWQAGINTQAQRCVAKDTNPCTTVHVPEKQVNKMETKKFI